MKHMLPTSEVAKRHTAEHIFMRTLTNMLENVRVVKVEHYEDINKIFLEADELSWDDVIRASKKTNEIIREGRSVRIEHYESIKEAKEKYPDLRAYESRISGKVRVVVIEGYDSSACKMPHVSSTKECIMFLPVNLTKVRGNLYEVEYYAGEDAVFKAIEYTGILVKILRRYNVNLDDVFHFIENLENENNMLKNALKGLTKMIIESTIVKVGRYRYVYIESPYLDMNIAGRVISKRMDKEDIDLCAIFSYDGSKYRFLLASNKDVDINSIGRKLIEVARGKGGGRRGWFMGYITDMEKARKYLESII